MKHPLLSLTLAASLAAAPALAADAQSKGLEWLLKNQLPNGGWGQGEESMEMGRGLALKSTANVADSAIAVMALLRSGSSPKTGPNAAAAAKGIDFILSEIEASDADSMSVTRVHGTRVQTKLGPNVDTFMAAALLPELEGKMPDGKGESRLSHALSKVLTKMRKNQAQDGRFETGGWAPTLAQAMATRGINAAARNGIAVDEGMRMKAQEYAAKAVAAPTAPAEGSAGVGLYNAASTVSQMEQSTSTNDTLAPKEREVAKKGKTAAERKAATDKLAEFDAANKAHDDATKQVMGKLSDPSFVSGFGSNGGEEFLSYMLLAESLRAKHPKEFQEWESGMNRNLTRVQNGDGSWTGHHCITGRTFCTAAALLVLMADKAPQVHKVG